MFMNLQVLRPKVLLVAGLIAATSFTVFQAASAQTTAAGEWTWMGGSSTASAGYGQPGIYGTLGTPAPTNLPGAREYAANLPDGSGNLWLFGGQGVDGANILGYLNDLWQFNSSTNQWTWISGNSTVPIRTLWSGRSGIYGKMGTAAAGNMPGGRSGASIWLDSSGNLWLFGGAGYDSAGHLGDLNDLWTYNFSTKLWTWMGGSSTLPYSSAGTGGEPGVYGALGTAAAANQPGSHWNAASWKDNSGHFWIFGGEGNDSSGNYGLLNDLWEYNPSSGQWTWMGGSNVLGANGYQPGIYGTLGTPAAGNIPGSRIGAASCTQNGLVWLLGGQGSDANAQYDELNDLWSFNPSTNEWTWVSGSSTRGSMGGRNGIYGVMGTPAPGNVPGARDGALCWNDVKGNLWLFSGAGNAANDLWEFNPAATQWAWMGGNNLSTNQLQGIYGTMGTPAADNLPGVRTNASSWTDSSGNLWLFGGLGNDADGYYNYLNDVWVYQPAPPKFTPTVTVTPSPSSPTTAQALAVKVTVSITGGGATPTGTVVLTGGGYTSPAAPLSGGSATVTIQPGLLPTGASTLTASFTPDAAAASFCTSASGTGSVTVTSSPQAMLTLPAPGSTLSGSSATFNWTAGTGVTQYQIRIGTTSAGSNDILSMTTTSLSSGLVSNIPSYGMKLYIRLYSLINKAWQYTDYNCTESGAPIPAALISPTPGSTLSGSSATFTWTAGGGVTLYQIRIGTTSAGSSNLLKLQTTALTSGLVSNIPTYGVPLYVRLYSLINGAWQSSDYTLTESGAPLLAALKYPAPGSTLTGSSATFQWTAGGGVTDYELRLGTTGASSKDVFLLITTALTSGVVTNIPINGKPLYARMYSMVNGAWQYQDYTYTEYITPVPAALTSPAPGSTLTGSTATFNWSAGTSVTNYQIMVGTTGVGANNLFRLTTTALTSGVVNNIPITGGTLYVRLYSLIAGAWQYTDYTYTEQ